MAAQESYRPDMLFRLAQVEEDERLSRILCNAFLPLWNHNWFQGISQPLEPVAIAVAGGNKVSVMNRTQACRVRFYLGLIKLTRLLGGSVLLNEVNTSDSAQAASRDIGAILLWLPPSKRLGPLELGKVWSSGMLSLVLPWNYGLSSFYRIDNIFEANITSMFKETLTPRGLKEHDCGFVQMIAANPAYKGNGFASALLSYQMEQHFSHFPETPVVLDTTTEQGVRSYTRLGFQLLAEKPVQTGTDAGGVWLRADADEACRDAARKVCVQRVMIKMP